MMVSCNEAKTSTDMKLVQVSPALLRKHEPIGVILSLDSGGTRQWAPAFAGVRMISELFQVI